MTDPTQSNFVQIWRCQWGAAEDIERWQKQGVPCITADRLADTMGKAYEQGFERGKDRGRYEMRQDIEQGRIEPIEPLRDEGRSS